MMCVVCDRCGRNITRNSDSDFFEIESARLHRIKGAKSNIEKIHLCSDCYIKFQNFIKLESLNDS